MKTYCEIPKCENQAVKEVPVSVDKPSDETRSLCAVCEEAYSWGLQHGTMVSQHKQLWLVAIADKGIVVYTKAYPNANAAIKAVAEYLKDCQRYQGPADSQAIYDWLEQHDENLSVAVVCQPGMSEQDNQAESAMSHLNRFLLRQGFVVLGLNRTEPSPGAPYEAWAYQGPLDFQAATPVTFGLGANIPEVLEALNLKLQNGPQTMARENNRDSGDQNDG